MTRAYEFMVVLRPDFDAESGKKREDIIKKLLGEGNVKEVISLGKKVLAYPIKKQTEAVFIVAQVEGLANVTDIDKRAKLDESVLRFLLTTKE